MRRGFTLIEMLAVLHIVALVGVLSYPAFVSARRSANVTRSAGQMQQIHRAALLYIADEGGGDEFDAYPKNLSTLIHVRGLPEELLWTHGRSSENLGRAVYTWMPAPWSSSPLHRDWRHHVEVTRGNPSILTDSTQNDGSHFEVSRFDTRFTMAIFHDGHLQKKRTTGSIMSYETWEQP